ncbi:MAG: hypothetical protein JSW58_11005 [Candidatus Latescibacterota bacterium]|nr:MAG: hypothetical protein JSW58_11005 [Candidatus Latescibacterota bacterium]
MSAAVKVGCVNGDFSYSDQLCELKRGDVVEITSEQGYPIAVHIGWKTPFNKGRDRAPAGEKIELTVLSDAIPGEYKYLVAVYEPKKDKIWTDDPYFIIKP